MTQSAREKISLFHLCRIVMWAISSVVSVIVVAMVNFIPNLQGVILLASGWHWPRYAIISGIGNAV